MKIIVLDGVPLNPGDLDWAPLRELGEVTVYDNTAPADVVARIGDAPHVFTNKVRLPREVLEAVPQLKFVGVLATGYDIVDVQAAREYGVTVCNVPSYSADFTAQSTFALLLELTHHAGDHSRAVHAGEWSRSKYFSYWDFPLVELSGKTLLIVGLGRIGTRVARIASALGLKVLSAQLPGRDSAASGEFPRVPLDDALPDADVVSLHCPLTPDTSGLINAQRLARMKPSALLVNTARGGLIDEAALAEALRDNRIAGFACDVLSQEPPPVDNPLLGAPRCIITPHLSWASPECRARLIEVSAENLRKFLQGAPQNVVS